MIRLIFALALVFISLLSLADTEAIVGICQVTNLFAGTTEAIIDVTDCSGNLGFKEKRLSLPYVRRIRETVNSCNSCNPVTIEKVQDGLAMKQTAELAFLFQKKLRVQLEHTGSSELYFLSLLEPVSFPSAPPVNPPTATPPTHSSPNVPSEPSTPSSPPSNNDFKPVPPPPHGLLKWLGLD